MSSVLKIILIILGLVGLGLGVLIWLFFHQGGCCIRKAKAKITRRDYVAPILKRG